MDLYTASYLMMFVLFLSIDFDLFGSGSDDDNEPTPPLVPAAVSVAGSAGLGFTYCAGLAMNFSAVSSGRP